MQLRIKLKIHFSNKFIVYQIILNKNEKLLSLYHSKKLTLMYLKSANLLALLFLLNISSNAQNVKFGNVSPKDFDISKINVDTTKGAIIISDVGESSFEGNYKGWFSLVFKRKERILILNKNAFDLAKVEIPLYFDKKENKEEKLDKLKASTYNLVDGKVVETKMSGDAVFKDNYDKNHLVQKFNLPAVKEGSIIEYSYTINSDYLFNLQPWQFQGSYPRLWSEYNVSIPEFFEYVILAKGYVKYEISEHPVRNQVYNVNLNSYTAERAESVKLDSRVTDHRWAMKDVPALTEEKYTSTLSIYLSRIQFQLSGYRFKDQPYLSVIGNWATAGEKLMQLEGFGDGLKRNNNWLDDEIKSITAGTTDKFTKAYRIYNYVKNNIKCSDDKGIYLTKSLKEVFKSKSGSVADVNLLLTAMFRYENLEASPVILSTKSHGHTNEYYPLLEEYNYVICCLQINDNGYFLDASKPLMGFNRLPLYTYNGTGEIIDNSPKPVDMLSDNLAEEKTTQVMLFADEKSPGSWEGNVDKKMGYNESYELRNRIQDKGKADFEKSIAKGDYKISDFHYDDLDSLEKPVSMGYNIALTDGANSDIIYFNPLMIESYSTNPFQSAERRYPVEMPYKMDETYFLTMDIPAGYVVDEMPKQTKALLNDGEAVFEYLISKNDLGINMKCHIKFNKATFTPDDYESLRNFFGMIVKKESEQIVFKKKK